MDIVSILNRITFRKLPDSFFTKNLPIFIGTARGGHTTMQNWINVTLLDYLEIDYSLFTDNNGISFKQKDIMNPLQPLDLRSSLNKYNPLLGYISNDPGHAFRLKNRRVFIFIRSPIETYQSLYVYVKNIYKYDNAKARRYQRKYLYNWSNRLKTLLDISKKRNLKISFFHSEALFKSPVKYIKNIFNFSNITIPEKLIEKSILKYDTCLKNHKLKSSIYNPRQSYKSQYIEIPDEDIDFIESLYLYKFYKNANNEI